MPIQKIGLNLSAIQNLTMPDFGLKNNTKDILNDVPLRANEITQGYLGLFISTGLFGFLFWKLSAQTELGGDFGYSQLKSFGLSCGIVGIMGLVCLNLGYFTNFYHIVIFILFNFVITALTWKKEV